MTGSPAPGRLLTLGFVIAFTQWLGQKRCHGMSLTQLVAVALGAN
jgi:hypothetical protein